MSTGERTRPPRLTSLFCPCRTISGLSAYITKAKGPGLPPSLCADLPLPSGGGAVC